MKTNIVCSCCGKDVNFAFFVKDINRKVSNNAFSYYKCNSCKYLFLWPIPENLNDYYPKEYYKIPSSISELEKSAKFEQYKIDLVKSFISTGNLLEIGPATGEFAYLAKRAGFNVETIEMDTNCCNFLTNVLKISAINTQNIISTLNKLSKFDIIVLWQVIEHLPDPWTVLKTLIGHLRPNGLLIISAPNPDALQFRIFGKFWTHLDAPRHLSLIPMNTLIRYMEKQKIPLLFSSTKDKEAKKWNVFGWKMSLNQISKSKFLRKALSLIGLFCSILLHTLESRKNYGTSYTVIFSKK